LITAERQWSECRERNEGCRPRASPKCSDEYRTTANDLRSIAKTVVVCYGFDAAGAGHSHVTALIPEVDPDHRHRGHDCWCLCRLDTSVTRDGNSIGDSRRALVDNRCQYCPRVLTFTRIRSCRSTQRDSQLTSTILCRDRGPQVNGKQRADRYVHAQCPEGNVLHRTGITFC